jgi:hypothetical protein
MPMEQVISLVSFALGFAGFVGSLLSNSSSRTRFWVIMLLACLVAFVATGSVSFWQSHQRFVHVQTVSEEILRILGKEAKTIDQLHEGLMFEHFGTVSEALGELVKANKVGHRVVEVKDGADLPYRTRLYFAR